MAHKRHRNTIVCTFCKRRKRKCDRCQPCSSCVKFGNPECTYDVKLLPLVSKPPVFDTSLRNELCSLSRKLAELEKKLDGPESESALPPPTHSFGDYLGCNPINSHKDILQLSQYSTTLFVKTGFQRSTPPLATLSMLRADPMVSALLEYANSVLVEDKTYQPVLNSKYAAIEKKFFTQDDVLNGMTASEPYKIGDKGPTVSVESEKTDEVSLTHLALEVLPVRKAIWRYINVFFSKIYPYYPILDQREFMDSINEILGNSEPNETRIKEIHITKKIDFAHLGILLLILRLSYLAITSLAYRANGDLEQPGSELAYLMDHPIDVKAVSGSKRCMDLFPLYSAWSIAVLQMAFLQRLYIIVAPEEGDAIRDYEAFVYDGVINNMAQSLGLNRDMVFTFGQGPDSRHRNLCQKIWLSVIRLNSDQCLRNGYRFPIDRVSYDTLPPSESEVTSSYDTDLERAVLNNLSKTTIEPEITRILDLVSNVRDGIPLVELCSLLEYFEKTYVKTYGGKRRDLIQENFPNAVDKMNSTVSYISMMVLDLTMLFFIYNYYLQGDNTEIQSFYVNKLIVTVCYEFLPFCCEIFQNSGKIFKEFGDIMILPGMFNLLYKAAIVLCSIHFRNKKALSTFRDDEEVCDILTQTNTILLKNLRNITDIFLYFSPWYFSAWRSSRNMVIVYDLMTGEGLYEFHSMRNAHGFSFPKSHFKKTLDVLRTSSEEWNQYRTTNEQGKEVFTFQTRALVNPTVEGPSEVSPATFLDTRKEVDSRWHETLASRSGMQPPSEDRSKWSGELQDELFANDLSRLFDSALVDDFFATYLNDQP
ncbi:hypothetical protein PSN45_001707 [Yamadazyma tenuis]|uniref:Zn(2)-C6 fungal-type domain-containing protein n=1 Tax=Candida tenuis (strain ATCC 10573 / BCRC 21748 / CBS 615 / JCM 9827 / NBRC 10315 / NRRL Y-1498 / VKM Y-70) TaxID=590646 RepID=G3BEF4_CANTC|nr:uncharacterized protein CANTEDRAFT_95982 [Yamadazyma tenuis ATCC 10573]EGV60533.1 hypothetical protein CANTEDRAFT_95982 [Yamadazyma tenuis ATCC 10573]WEJ94226.1 hypothetical protein PSN45_001707 [Yamadazyma tenuis]